MSLRLGFLFFFLAATTTSNQTIAANATKDYRAPGPVAISTAKRHGYRFTQTVRFSADSEKCFHQGSHWSVKPGGTCILKGFVSSKSRCKSLRSGWKVKDVQFRGLPYVWQLRPENKPQPEFQIKVRNTSSVMKPLTLDYITLSGPEGPFKDFENAFSHCSET